MGQGWRHWGKRVEGRVEERKTSRQKDTRAHTPTLHIAAEDVNGREGHRKVRSRSLGREAWVLVAATDCNTVYNMP